MKKMMKRIGAILLSVAMIAALGVSAWAADPVGAMTPDTEVNVGGLKAGDTVKFYKLIKWVPNEGWKWADGVEAAAAGDANADPAVPAITLPTLTTITGYLNTATNPASYVAGKISAADGGTLAQIAQRLGNPVDTETVATGANSVKYSKPAYAAGATDAEKEAADVAYMGLYVALVQSADPEILYNPIFVAADYNPDSTNPNTNTIGSEEIAVGTLSYSPKSLAKKEKVTLKKTSGTAADTQYDVAIGDTIPFTITSEIPAFSTSYLDPKYEISDKMSDGLELLTTPGIVVKVIESIASAETKADDRNWTTLTNQYTVVDADPDTSGFTVALTSDYLKNNATPKDIKVTYSAKVTKITDKNISQKENTATVKFSNNPSDTSSYSLLEDKTNHYIFSIDANLLGKDDWELSELVKIGMTPDGKEISETHLKNGVIAGVLEGAKFGLYTDAACTTLYTNNNVSPAITGEYTSTDMGKLKISGLDAGTYYLKEIKAPSGFIASKDIWEIKITTTYKTEPEGQYTNANNIVVKYDAYDYLDEYKIDVKNLTTNTTVTSDFKINYNQATQEKIAESIASALENDPFPDHTTKLSNTQGTELPSTGGIGTYVFTITGVAIMAIAAGLLVIRHKKKAE